MEKLDWIKDLARAEQQIDETGVIDFSAGFDTDKVMRGETVRFLEDIKEAFVEYANAFNQVRGATSNAIKIYGIANTLSDFMLFRNGFKLIFSMLKPGEIIIRFHHTPPGFLMSNPQSQNVGPENSPFQDDMIQAQWGAFGELLWTYRGLTVNKDNLVRYYLTRFISDSSR